jgi:phosphatidylglycerophosphatase A
MLQKLKTVFLPFDNFIAQGFGVGKLPMPGTLGTLMAYPLFYLISTSVFNPYIILCFVLFSIIIAGTAEKKLGQDHGSIIIDEVAGYFLVLFYIWSFPPIWHIAAFCLFRFLDVFKPFPLSWFQRHVTGGFGVVLDDLIAGALTLVIMFGVDKYF